MTVSGANRSSCVVLAPPRQLSAPRHRDAVRRVDSTVVQQIVSPGLKSDILHGKTDRFGRNLPLQRISCSRRLQTGRLHPSIRVLKYDTILFLKNQAFFCIFSKKIWPKTAGFMPFWAIPQDVVNSVFFVHKRFACCEIFFGFIYNKVIYYISALSFRVHRRTVEGRPYVIGASPRCCANPTERHIGRSLQCRCVATAFAGTTRPPCLKGVDGAECDIGGIPFPHGFSEKESLRHSHSLVPPPFRQGRQRLPHIGAEFARGRLPPLRCRGIFRNLAAGGCHIIRRV